MRELTESEIEEIGGGLLSNLGMGVAGATGGMATYALQGGIGGEMTGAGFVGSAVGGFVYGASGFNPAGGLAGAAIGKATEELLEDS